MSNHDLTLHLLSFRSCSCVLPSPHHTPEPATLYIHVYIHTGLLKAEHSGRQSDAVISNSSQMRKICGSTQAFLAGIETLAKRSAQVPTRSHVENLTNCEPTPLICTNKVHISCKWKKKTLVALLGWQKGRRPQQMCQHYLVERASNRCTAQIQRTLRCLHLVKPKLYQK